MISPYVAQLITADRMAEAQRHATTARLAAIARCCQPSTWGRAARRATTAVLRLRDALRRDRSAAAPCCA
ncbi:hypothetical protein [Geodermatophilus sp. SYSU D00079]